MTIKALDPSISPTLNLDFANVKALDPRITFTRASSGAVYDGKTVAKAEENLVLQSQDFTTTWAAVATTVTANTEVAPNGTTTADTITGTGGASQTRGIQQSVNSVSGASYTFSFFAKKGTNNFIQLRFGVGFGAQAVNFDLDAGVLGSTYNTITGSIQSVGNDWYRCIGSVTASSSSSTAVQIYLITAANAGNGEANTLSTTVFLWGAQLEQRSAVTAYTPTTTQPITNYVPVLLSAANNVARFDHNPTTFESLGLLIEELRSNLVLQSEDFSTTWAATRSTVATNQVVAPSGALTADILQDSTDNDTHFVSQSVTTTAVAITFSVYAKAAGRNFVTLTINDSGNVARTTFYNLSTGAVGTTGTGITASVVSVGNGWYRCIATVGTALAGSNPCVIGTASADNTASYAGNGFSGVAIWGAQVE
jgi:hypothetical protein